VSSVRCAWDRHRHPAAIETDIAMPLEVAISPRYEGWDWKRRWAHAQGELERLMARDTEELSGEAVKVAHRELQTFFVHTYHLKDALIAEASSHGLVPNHRGRDHQRPRPRPPRRPAEPRQAPQAEPGSPQRRRARVISTRGVLAGSGEGGWRLDVQIMHNGEVLDGLEVASAALEAWRRHLKQGG
jgi:hypothetical protein